jgi:hypothetical protein
MTIQNSRLQVDQPFVQSTTVGANDRTYIGNNDFNALPRTATVDVSLNNGANYNSVRLDPRNTTSPQDGPSIRVSMAKDNTVYASYFQWTNFNGAMATSNVVIVRDDNGGTGPNPFTALLGPGGQSGVFAAAGVQIPWSNAPTLGQERIGSTLSIAVDPNNSSTVYVAWGDRVGNGDIYTIHVRRSTDKGITWSQDLRARTNATNCSLAVADNGTVGFLYQQVTNGRWITHLEQTKDGFTTVSDAVLATVPSNVPAMKFLPYLGDYDFLLAVGSEFRGIFSANNTPDLGNFPQGVRYQRRADFTAHKLLDSNGNQVSISIDPFYFTIPVLH